MLEWPLNMALQWPQVETAKLMYISGLGKALDYKSDILAEYKRRSLELLSELEQANSPAWRMAPGTADMESVWHAGRITRLQCEVAA